LLGQSGLPNMIQLFLASIKAFLVLCHNYILLQNYVNRVLIRGKSFLRIVRIDYKYLENILSN
jgi:hypothetical protein